MVNDAYKTCAVSDDSILSHCPSLKKYGKLSFCNMLFFEVNNKIQCKGYSTGLLKHYRARRKTRHYS